MIKIQGLNKYFNKGKSNEIHVINDISLELPKSGIVAIFGKSGCGKTTLLNVIGGLDGFSGGSLAIDGNDIRRDTDNVRNKYVGYIFQNYNLNKTESCYDNVANALRLCGMADGEHMQSRVMAALRNVGMENYHARTPDTLSGGQQQRIAIARAIVKNPSIILADEPTGNLDEANTVMIMDLLKQISKDRLVLLVTHEANLVDYYCDTVIELMDGKVVSIRNNEDANGYVAKGRNDIYLGELDKNEIGDTNAQIEFYGDTPDTPVKIKIVNNGGKLYVRIDTPKVQVIDQTSEVKLREGVYQNIAADKTSYGNIDMSDLPPIEGKRFGRLFTFKSAIKSGYAVNFKKGKRGKKVLRNCMCLFAAVIVFMSAFFGTAFADLRDARNSYNHNVFYLYTPDGNVSEKLLTAMENGEAGIDYIRLLYGVPSGDMNIKFMSGYFESFKSSAYDETYTTNAVLLDDTLIKDMRAVAGRTDELKTNEIVITTRVADALLEVSTLGYISEYDDLIGMISTAIRIDGQNAHICGIVESDESAVYLSEQAMARYALSGTNTQVSLASDSGFDAPEGEAIYATRYTDGDVEIPSIGEKIKIHGVELKVSSIIKYCNDYSKWLEEKGKQSDIEEWEYFRNIAKQQNPELDEYEIDMLADELRNKGLYDYYDEYYKYFDEFMRELYMFEGSSNIDIWLYVEKGIEEIKYNYISTEYYIAQRYKESHGTYPTQSEVYTILEAEDKNLEMYNTMEAYRNQYNEEFYRMSKGMLDNMYYVSDADYVAISKRIGETHESATLGAMFYSEGFYESPMKFSGAVIGGADIGSYSTSSSYGYSNTCYTVIHSSDPQLTDKWLAREFSSVKTKDNSQPALLTPDQIFDRNVANSSDAIFTSIVTMAVILALMSVCMYFIMRSALLNRIKEVGIYRAIGVSKKNLRFRFLIEALLLTTLTVLIGYLITSVLLGVCLNMSPLMKSILYYPLWLAGAVFGILYAVCLFFGTLPVNSLLRKTPSEILAKYDI